MSRLEATVEPGGNKMVRVPCPRVRTSPPNKRTVRLYLCALALLLGVSIGYGQWLETTIMLPDTLGPLIGPYHLAWDSDSAHPRLYIGSEEGDVIVADAVTYQRLARIPTKPVHEMLFCSLGCPRMDGHSEAWV